VRPKNGQGRTVATEPRLWPESRVRSKIVFMTLPNQASRPSKYTNAQTILYEIDMLRFTAGRFEKSDNEWGEWSNLECFLLHFRNLIEFFGNQPRGDDLNIQRPERIWIDPRTMPSPAELAPLRREDLWKKYEVRDPSDQTQANDKVSRYLQHCTEQRVDGKEWKVGEMFAELEPLMSTFENLLPDKSRPWEAAPASLMLVVGNASYSTATSSPRTTTFVSPPAKARGN
jgi:hypothetical protein